MARACALEDKAFGLKFERGICVQGIKQGGGSDFRALI